MLLRFGLLGALFVMPVFAHPEMGDFVQHRIVLAPSDEYLDLTIELIFDSNRSLAARQRMDADKDGSISEKEQAAFVKEMKREVAGKVRIEIDGKPVRLKPAHDPELDLLDAPEDVSAHPYFLRVCYFAKTRVADALNVVVFDGLWESEAAVLLPEQGEGGGVRLLPIAPDDPAADNPAPTGKPRVVRFAVGKLENSGGETEEKKTERAAH